MPRTRRSRGAVRQFWSCLSAGYCRLRESEPLETHGFAEHSLAALELHGIGTDQGDAARKDVAFVGDVALPAVLAGRHSALHHVAVEVGQIGLGARILAQPGELG